MYSIGILSHDEKLVKAVETCLKENFSEEEYTLNILDNHEKAVSFNQSMNIVFLDTDIMPSNTAFEKSAKKFYNNNPFTRIIMCSSSTEEAVFSYQIMCKGYVVKPAQNELILQYVNRCISDIETDTSISIYAKTENGKTRLSSKSILYAEVYSHDVIFYYLNGAKVSSANARGSLVAFEKIFETSTIVRCNNYSLVNLNFISSVKNNKIHLSMNNISISVGRSFRSSFNKRFQQFYQH